MYRLSRETLAKVIPWGVCCVGLFLALQPMFLSGFQEVPGDFGDARLVHYTLEHAHRYLTGDPVHRDFWDPPLFYPARNVAAFTDTMVFLAPFYSPWRLIGFSPIAAFQAWLIFVFLLNFWSSFALFRRAFGLTSWPAAAGAYLFAFGSPRMINIGHPQLVPGFYPILAIFALSRVFRPAADSSPIVKRCWIAVFFLSLILQAWSAFYPAFFLVLVIGLSSLVALLIPLARQALFEGLWEQKWAWAALALVTVGLLLPLIQHYGLTAEILGERPWAAHERNIPRWQSWWLMGIDNWLFGDFQDSRQLLSHGNFLRGSAHSNGWGVVTFGLIALGFLRNRSWISTRLAVGAVVLTVLVTTMFPGGVSGWRLLYEFLPGASAIRVPGRIGLTLLIPASLGLAFFFQSFRFSRFRILILMVLFTAMVAEHRHLIPHYDQEISKRRIAAVSNALQPKCEAFFVSTLHKRPERTIHEDAMWASLNSGIPTINGRYGNFPPGWRLFEVNRRPGNEARLQQIRTFLADWIEASCIDPRGVCWVEVDSFRREGSLLAVPGVDQEVSCGS